MALMAFSSAPAAALTPGELLEKIIPRSDPPPHQRRSRLKTQPPAAAAKPPLPAPKPDDTPASASEAEPKAQPGAPTAAPPLPTPSPSADPVPPPAESKPPLPEPSPEPVATPPDETEPAAPVDLEATVPPTAPVAEPAPAAGTVIPPAEALGNVIPPVLPQPLPPVAAPAEMPTPATKPDAPAASNEPPRYLPTADELAACSAGMASLAIIAKAEPPIVEGECGAPDPFNVTALQSGAVTLSPAATLDCAMASALATWVGEDVQSAAKAAFGAPVTKIDVAGSYTCRGRNNVAGARLSEHAFANAIDIAGFAIGSRVVQVAKSDGQRATDAAFIELIRLAACRRFTTVLGPGSDVEHASHLHLDAIKRGRTGDYRICE